MPTRSQSKQSKKTSPPRLVHIEWEIPDDVQNRYANNVVVQHSQYEFTISFFEVRPPMLWGSPEEKKELISNITSIPAQCVARIVVSPDKMPEIINALQDNFQKYLAKTEQDAQTTE